MSGKEGKGRLMISSWRKKKLKKKGLAAKGTSPIHILGAVKQLALVKIRSF